MMRMTVRFMLVAIFIIGFGTISVLTQGRVSTIPTASEGATVRDATGGTFGPIQIVRRATLDGSSLAPGTYFVRITNETVDDGQWVEFTSGSRVVGRELATVVSHSEIRSVAKLPPPPMGQVRVDTLKDADYLRVWINDGATHYLIHLPLG